LCEIWLHDEKIGDFMTLSFDRYDKQEHNHEMPWGTTHFELWIRAQSFSHIAPARSNIAQPSDRTSQLGPFVPIGFCRA
jgi:hypothetical protein